MKCPTRARKRSTRVTEDGTEIKSVFQIAAVTRPLMSVGKICDEDLTVVFQKRAATIFDKEKNVVCIFERSPGGLYVAKLRLKAPASGFTRPA